MAANHGAVVDSGRIPSGFVIATDGGARWSAERASAFAFDAISMSAP